MDLRRLTQNTGCRLLRGDALTEVTSVCCDSRCAGPGALFGCLPGLHADGHDFAAQAVAAGAVAVLCAHDLDDLPAGCAVLLAGDLRRAMATLSARLYGEPARAMTMLGVTGTKGNDDSPPAGGDFAGRRAAGRAGGHQRRLLARAPARFEPYNAGKLRSAAAFAPHGRRRLRHLRHGGVKPGAEI